MTARPFTETPDDDRRLLLRQHDLLLHLRLRDRPLLRQVLLRRLTTGSAAPPGRERAGPHRARPSSLPVAPPRRPGGPLDAGPRGHLNGDSGLGDWPEGRALLDALHASR